jgi:hypothetical protein
MDILVGFSNYATSVNNEKLVETQPNICQLFIALYDPSKNQTLIAKFFFEGRGTGSPIIIYLPSRVSLGRLFITR